MTEVAEGTQLISDNISKKKRRIYDKLHPIKSYFNKCAGFQDDTHVRDKVLTAEVRRSKIKSYYYVK